MSLARKKKTFNANFTAVRSCSPRTRLPPTAAYCGPLIASNYNLHIDVIHHHFSAREKWDKKIRGEKVDVDGMTPDSAPLFKEGDTFEQK